MKIGFPRALFYYDYFPFWAGFFYALDIEVVLSPPTNRKIMEQGLKKAGDETCLPIKLLAGHIQALEQENVAGIFLPRMVSAEAGTYCCPKMLGIPESVLTAVPKGTPVFSATLNWQKGKGQVLKDLQILGLELGKSNAEVREALALAQAWQQWERNSRGADWRLAENIAESIKEIKGKEKGNEKGPKSRRNSERPSNSLVVRDSERLRIALVGHSYLTYEPYANHNLLRRLRERADLEVAQNVRLEEIEEQVSGLRKKMFWNQAKVILGAGYKFAAEEQVDGLIYLTCFGCGTDSMIQGFLAQYARERHKPFMLITLDEHTGEAGLVTRLEAFLDMVERRKALEDHVSPYGECLDRCANPL